MTADRAAKRPPLLPLSAVEWKLWITAALGAVYTASWMAIAGSSEPPRADRRPAAGPGAAPRLASAPAARARRAAGRVRTRSS